MHAIALSTQKSLHCKRTFCEKKDSIFLKTFNTNYMLRNSNYTVHDMKWNIHIVLSRHFIKKVPITLFEKYVETWYLFFSKGLTKQESPQKACSSWKTSSLEERQQLIKKHITTYQQKHGKNTLFSFGFSRSGRNIAQMRPATLSEKRLAQDA